MRGLTTGILLAGLAMSATRLAAQDLGDSVFTTVQQQGQNITLTTDRVNIATTAQVGMEPGYITCAAPLDCAKVKVISTLLQHDTAGDKKSGDRTTALRFSFARDQLVDTSTVSVRYDDKKIGQFQLTRGGRQPKTQAPSDTAVSRSLTKLLTSPACQQSDIDAAADAAPDAFVVDPNGSVLARPRRTPREDSDITVIVIGDSDLLPAMIVRRRSAFRTIRLNNIISGNVSVQALASDLRHAGGEPVKPKCSVRSFTPSDFAPGKGEVELSALTDEGPKGTGSFDFGVRELYTGAFTLGGFWTRVESPTFGTATVARDTVIGGTPTTVLDTVVTKSADRGSRLLYFVGYTPFIWGKRDPEEPHRRWYERINPMVGVALSDIPHNGILGVSADLWNRLYVHAGVHAARVERLDPNAQLAEGSRLTGGREIPITRTWKTAFFWGASVDLQAGVDLLHSILGNGGSE